MAKQQSTRRFLRLAGGAAVVGALLAVAGNAVVFAADPKVPSDVVSYPLSPEAFRFGQIFFALTQGLMAAGVIGLVRCRTGGDGRLARSAAILAAAGFLATVPGELVLALVAAEATDSAGANAASSLFGLGMLVADAGLILLGIQALRARLWAPVWAALPVVLGGFQLLIVTPVVLGSGFASGAAFAAITVFDAMVALLGLRLLRVAGPVRPPSRMPTSSTARGASSPAGSEEDGEQART